MNKTFAVWMGLVALAGVAYAGYETIPESRGRESAAKAAAKASVVDRTRWTGSMEMPDGSERALQNVSGRFLPIQLEAGETCAFAISGPGLLPGRTVVLSCSCGGFVEGALTAEVPVSADGVLRFSFRNGTFGAQPIEATLLGQRQTLLLVHAVTPVSFLRTGDGGGGGETNNPSCDNQDPPECPPGTCCSNSAGPNRFNVYSANVKREIEDMRLPVQVGEKPLSFARTQSSRTSWAVQERTDFPFGRAGNWRHSHQWTILDDGETNGCRKLQVIAPDGRVSYYNKKSPDDLFLTYLPSTHSRVEVDGSATNYYLYELDGTKYHITQWGDTNEPAFRMEGFWDAYSNWYGYAYDADGYLTRVTGPNTNHYFALEYRPLDGAVPPGTVRFTYSNAAAAEVLLPASWNAWTGSATPMHGDGTGVWTADVPLSEGCFEYKFAVRETGSPIWQMVTDPDNPITVGSDSNSLAVVSAEKIISKVTGGDGREVAYTYDWDWNPTQYMLAMRLREVAYGTGESALYDYYPASTDQGRSILLKSADDPHGHAAGRAIRYTYHTERDYSGQIHEERQLSTDAVLATLEYDEANPLIRHVLSADGTTNDFRFVNGAANLTQTADAAGQTTAWTYFGGNGMLQSRTDPKGRVTTYTRTWHFGAELSVSNSCSCQGDHVNTYTDETYPFYLATKTDAAGNTTTYQRDSRHRPTAILYPDGTSEFFAYNENGQILWERRRDGTAWTNTYDARGRKIAVSGPAGAWTGYGYDAYDRITSETNAVGLVTRHEYDWEGRKTRTVHPDGTEQRWAYDRYGSVTQSVDRAGGVTTHEYDERGNRIRTTEPLGAVTVWTYDAKGRKLTETTPLGLVISNTYDTLDRFVLRTYSSDGTAESWTYVYDGISTHTDRLGNVTSNSYDFEGHLTAVTDARGNTTSYTYDILGRRTAVTDALGHTTTQTFDPAGRVTSVTDAAGLAQTNTYDAYGRLAATVRRGGFTNEFLYDALNRRIETLLNGQTVASSAYDPAGRPLWTRNADGLVVSNVYDNAGRLWKTVMPDGTYAENTYSNAFLWQTTDRAGRTTTTDWDLAGRPVRVTDPAGGVVQYRYDVLGNLTNLVDQAGIVTAWTYDAEGRQTRKTYADGSHYDYTYDALGRLASRTDAKNQTTTYAYDPNGNLNNILYPDTSSVVFAYDALGKRTNMADSVGTTSWRYDELNRLTGETGPFGTPEVQLAYDAGGRITNVTWGTYWTSYAYDALGRIANVVSADGEYTFTYLSNGIRRAILTYPNSVMETRGHDGLARVTSLAFSSATNEWLSIAYAYDAADQRTNEVWSNGRAMSYSYDAIGQLIQVDATHPSDAARYAYDATGNPIRRAELGFEVTNAFNNLNQILSGTWTGTTITAVGSVNYPDGTVSVGDVSGTIYSDKTFDASGVPVVPGANTITNVFTDPYGRNVTNTSSVTIMNRAYTHDANGNLTNNGVFSYAYDYMNQLTNVLRVADGTRVLSVRYDALGRRVEATRVDGSVERYVYFPGSFLVLAIIDPSNTAKEIYTRAPDLTGSLDGGGGIGGIMACMTNVGITHYYHTDLMGNVLALTDAAGDVVSTFRYTPFGRTIVQSGTCLSRFLYASKEYEASVGLYYFGYRYYEPSHALWITRDPLGYRSCCNLYQFNKNNALLHFDALGLYEASYVDSNLSKKEHENYMRFSASCDACEKVVNPSVDYGGVEECIVDKIKSGLSEQLPPPIEYDSLLGTPSDPVYSYLYYLNARYLENPIETFRSEIGDNGSLGYVEQPEDAPCDGSDVLLTVHMRTRLVEGGIPGAVLRTGSLLPEKSVSHECYKENTIVTYDCEKCSE